MERKQNVSFNSVDELRAYLESEGVPIEDYGHGSAKTLEHLFNEISRGECLLVKEQGEVLRIVRAAAASIFYQENGSFLLLKEFKQVFTDGRERFRDFDWSISEKLGVGEEPLAAAKRALIEELQIDTEVIVVPDRVENKRIESPSYPGITTQYETSYYIVFLPDEAFRPEGYTEIQPDKTTYFTWQPVK